MTEQELRRERMRRRRERERARKRRRLLLIPFVLIVLLLLSTLVRLLIPRHTAFAGGEALSWYIHHRDGDLIETPLSMAGYEAMSNLLVEIEPGKNHNKKASAYAYDTAYVRSVIRGEEEYNGKKIAFLTFDDGPNHKISPKVLDVLKEKKVPATFFVVGRNLTDKYKDVLFREMREGHAIAMHSLTHDYSKLYPGRVGNTNRIGYEAQETQKILQEYFGPDFKSTVWRYPGGHLSWKGLTDGPDQAVRDAGAEWVDWNCLIGDAEPKRVRPTTTAGMVEYLDKSLKANRHQNMAVVLMHDAENKSLTLEALPDVIDYFQEEGYTFGILN